MSITAGTYVVESDNSGNSYRRVNVGGVSRPVQVLEFENSAGDGLVLLGEQNRMPVQVKKAATAGAMSTFSSTSDAQILAPNANRLGATIYNRGEGTLYVLLGTGTASITSFTVRLLADQYYELPAGYTGQVRGIFGAAGSANVQELT